ncbi:myb-like protein AA isoform X2 [Myzus persicae]|uniref:myb-like protein AA isoform X2 n=1 Tax=Myzus persicae TaxID=13164 RepID=UPI000B932FC4|nr:myb-like protein AA isoform X2 [Myzus persicae]
MDRNNRIYNFGPDGRDACWAALSNSWSRCQYQQVSVTSRSVSSCRSIKKTSVLQTSLSPRPKPQPSSSPRTPKPKSFKQLDTQQQLKSANSRLSSSVEVIKQVISEPPSTNDQCNCSQSGYSELSVVNSVISNNNNNNDDKSTHNLGSMETVDVVNQKQQQLMCADNSGSSVDITEPTTVYSEKPVIILQNECGDHIVSVSSPSTPSTTNEQQIENAQQSKGENVSSVSSELVQSTANKQLTESAQQSEGENVSSVSSELVQSTANKQPIESAQQIEDKNVSSVSSILILSTANKQPFKSTQQIEGENVSSVSCPLTPSTTVDQQFKSVLQVEGDNVSSMYNPLSSSITIEQQIESVQNIEVENVSSVSCQLTMSTAVEQQINSEQQIKSDPVLSVSSLLFPSMAAENLMMPEVTNVENLTALKVVMSSSQLQPLHEDDDECPVQSNTEIMVLSEKPALSKYETKIKEIDNNIISYSKSILCTVLVVVVLRVLF